MQLENLSSRQKFLLFVLFIIVASIRLYYGLYVSDKLVIANLKSIAFSKNFESSGRNGFCDSFLRIGT